MLERHCEEAVGRKQQNDCCHHANIGYAIGVKMDSPHPSGRGRYMRDDSDSNEEIPAHALIHFVLFRRVKRHLL